MLYALCFLTLYWNASIDRAVIVLDVACFAAAWEAASILHRSAVIVGNCVCLSELSSTEPASSRQAECQRSAPVLLVSSVHAEEVACDRRLLPCCNSTMVHIIPYAKESALQ